ncbi:uncharacterized protein BT62DRAFT_930411 [Guyanagaster necrorhizus]|uniref:Uncharacterized protein n=1 Tax=Guyanagaster necrorhizus TaxID=856835 RepID=A0A9P7VWR1_9AGAR|nr:uncharacterized protein BT62DRAFT_930411 [Guyanagaster necrorhizus MCA 3950]KAG7448322.1 hypothetical protein BT62DRAFT_930411 [Guyanagaster necrorhizus MCA 3950]
MTTNTLPLTRPMLEMLLNYLCDQLSNPGSPYHIPSLLLVIHGGAAMLLHPSYQTIPTSRQSTLDVDYLAQPFSTDVCTTITRAIAETSRAFPGLGADWMNADADVALPPGVWEGSTHPGNLAQNTIFDRGTVRMVSVSPGWAVGLKLMRYEKYDPGDVVVILLNGLRVKGGGKWTLEIVEGWVRAECATMGYDGWPAWKLAEMRVRIRDAVRLVEEWLRENPGVVTKTITRQTSVMSVQEEAEIREWERSLRREKKRTKPNGRYLMGEWVEPDDSDSDSESDTSTDGDVPPTPHLPTSQTNEAMVSPYQPSTQLQSCSPQVNLYQPPTTSPYQCPSPQNNPVPQPHGYIPPTSYSMPSHPLRMIPQNNPTRQSSAYLLPNTAMCPVPPNFVSPIYASPNPNAFLSPFAFSTPY